MAAKELSPACHIITPVGMLGYSLSEPLTAGALEKLTATGVPTAIILDSGSTDGGPTKLAQGSMTCPSSAYKRDLKKLLKLVDRFHVPLIFSSAGGDGSDQHVEEMLRIIEEIAEEPGSEHYHLKTIAVFSDISKRLVLDRLHAGKISGCGPAVPDLTKEDVENSKCIVAQAGPEPFLQAMRANPDFNVLVGGRAYDPAPYVAFAAFKTNSDILEKPSAADQLLWGGFTHMGKIMECGGICAQPKTPGAIATVYMDGTFDITPLHPDAKCTPLSVAAHTLYEKTRPDILHGPGGYLDVTHAEYEQLSNEKTVRVRGGRFVTSAEARKPYQIKLEAATVVGYRSMFMGSIKDPLLIHQIDNFLARVKEYAEVQLEEAEENWELDFHVYGKPKSSDISAMPQEIFIIGEALAETQELASTIISSARVATIHGPYPGQKATSGNLAHGIGGKTDLELGECAKFSLYHLLDLEKGEEGLQVSNEIITKLEKINFEEKIEEGQPLFREKVFMIGRNLPPVSEPSPVDVKKDNKSTTASAKEKRVQQIASAGDQIPVNLNPGVVTLGSIAKVLRSKNAGPFEITFDIMFATETVYQIIKDSGILSAKTIASLYDISEEEVIWAGFFDPAMAFKATIPRVRDGKKIPNGGYMEFDVHGAQQYMPLAEMRLSPELIDVLNNASIDGFQPGADDIVSPRGARDTWS